MRITLNGELEETGKPSLTLAELLGLKQVEHPEMVSVQLNGKFVETGLYATTAIQENDEVDFLYFLGGGRDW